MESIDVNKIFGKPDTDEHQYRKKDFITGGEITKEDFAKMGYQARLKLFNENPKQYKALVEESRG